MSDTKNFWYCSIIVNRPEGPCTHLVRAASKPNPTQLHEAFPYLVEDPDMVAGIEMLTDEAAASHPDLYNADARPIFDEDHNGAFGLYSVVAHMLRGGTRLPYLGLVAADSAREAVAKAEAYLETTSKDLSAALGCPVSFAFESRYAHRVSNSHATPVGNAEMAFKFLVA